MVVAGRFADLIQVQDDHDGGGHTADDHQGFSDSQLVGNEPEEDYRDDVESPVPVPEGVPVVDREAEKTVVK